jgi:hypothetical protein
MTYVDPLLAAPPKLADTAPGLGSALASPKPTTLERIRENAAPLLLGAGVGAGLAFAVTTLTYKKGPRFTLFPVSQSTLLGSVAKVALLAVGRALLRRVLADAVAKGATEPV